MPPDQTDFGHAAPIPERLGRTRGKKPSLHGKVYGDLDSRTRALEKRVDGEWVYVGSYPADDNTTPDSPPFQNSWENVGSGKLPLRYRWTLSGRVEIDGVITGGNLGTVIFTLPERLWPDEEYKVPFAADDSTPATLCVETDGDVVFCAIASSGGGAAGDPLATLRDFGTMIGWWRMGDSAPDGDVANIEVGTALFANSAAPNCTGEDMVVSSLGNPTATPYLWRTNGEGPAAFTDAFDDGAALTIVGANALTADLNPPNVVWANREPFTYAFWFLPGYGNNPEGLVMGTSFQMDGGGSYNVGEGFTWNPNEGSLAYKHWGSAGFSERVTIFYPIVNTQGYQPPGWNPNNQTDPSDQWWADHGFDDEVVTALPVFSPPGVRRYSASTDPWWHIGLVCDGYSLFAYLNGTLFAQRAMIETSSMLGDTLRVGRTEMDSGVSSYWSGGGFGLDEVMMWAAALTPAQMGTVYRLGTSSSATGQGTTNAATLTNNIGSTRTATDSMEVGETFIVCDTSSGGFTFTLCPASAMPGIAIVIKKLSGSNTLTVEGFGSETIDGALNFTLTTAWSSITLISDGTQWLSVA